MQDVNQGGRIKQTDKATHTFATKISDIVGIYYDVSLPRTGTSAHMLLSVKYPFTSLFEVLSN